MEVMQKKFVVDCNQALYIAVDRDPEARPFSKGLALEKYFQTSFSDISLKKGVFAELIRGYREKKRKRQERLNRIKW